MNKQKLLLVQLCFPLSAKAKQKCCAAFFWALFWKSKQRLKEYLEKKQKYYLSLSLPKIIQNKYQNSVSNLTTNAEVRQLYFAGGMIINISENLQFKPTFMTRTVMGVPFQYDISGNFLLAKKFWLGAMYRSGDAIGAIAQWIINPNIRFGYAYDFTLTNMRNFHSGIHEVMISYEFIHPKRRFISPRTF